MRLWKPNVLIQYGLIVGLNGTAYLDRVYPDDSVIIEWINKNINGQPVILEAVGDSYTDFARIAANTGLPTVLGWPVHEWLWRGSWGDPVQPESRVLREFGSDSVAQRVEEVRQIYEASSAEEAQELLHKYNVKYIYIGNMEREKYPDLRLDQYVESLGYRQII